MNFDKESKSGINFFFFFWGGGGGDGGGSVVEKGASSMGKYVFPIYEYIITYKISSS